MTSADFQLAVLAVTDSCGGCERNRWGPCCVAGTAADVLQILSRLPELRTLDLGHQHLSGSLPTNVSFASLTTLRLTNTHITVSCKKLGFICIFPGVGGLCCGHQLCTRCRT